MPKICAESPVCPEFAENYACADTEGHSWAVWLGLTRFPPADTTPELAWIAHPAEPHGCSNESCRRDKTKPEARRL